MQNVLSKAWDQATRQVIIDSINQLSMINTKYISRDEYILLEKNISEALGQSYAEMVKSPVIELQKTAYFQGGAKGVYGSGISFAWNLSDLKSLKVLDMNTLFWIGDYYPAQIQAGVKETLTAFFEGGSQRHEVLWDLKLGLEESFNAPLTFRGTTHQYWDSLADHTCTKIREIGRVSGYESAGIEKIIVRAMMDNRTSEICRFMNGRVIETRYLRRQVEGYLKACLTKDKNKIKNSWKWIPDKKAIEWKEKGKSTAYAVKYGVACPPYHFNCRTVTVAYLQAWSITTGTSPVACK